MADIKITVDSSQIRQAKADTKALEAATTRFDKKLDPLLKKEKAFATAVKQVNDAMRLGVATQKQAIAEIERLGRAYGQTQAQIDRTTASMTGIRKNTNRMNATIQNAGYQFGDFFVQVQSGQNILVAFSQQGAQLAGLLPGLAGAVTGVGLVIGSMLVRALMDGSSFMKGFGQAVEEITEKLTKFEGSFKRVSKGFRDELGPEVERFAKVILQKDLRDATKALEKDMGSFGGYFSKLGGQIRGTAQEVKVLKAAYKSAEAAQAAIKLDKLEGIRDTIQGISDIDPTNAEELQAAIDAISSIIEQDLAGGLELGKGEMKSLVDLSEALLSVLDTITPEQEAQTDELERQEALLRSITSLERQRLSIGEGLDKAFARTTLVMEGMEEGLSKGVASQIASMRLQIQSERDAMAALFMEEQAAFEQGIPGFVPTIPHAGDIESQYQTRMQQLEAYQAQLLRQEQMSRASRGGGSRRSQVDAHVKEYERLQQNIEDTLKSYQKQAQLELKLIGLSKEEAELTKFVFDLEKKLGVTREQLNVDQQAQYDAILAAKQKEIELTKQQQEEEEKLAEAKKRVEAVASSLASETVGALKSIANGTKTASEAFRDMALNIIQQIMDILIWQPLIESLTRSISGAFTPAGAGGTGIAGGFISSLFGFQNGGAFSAGNVIPFARGGVVGSPTYFGMSGGRTGLMGEAGPEAILPLKRGAGGKLGVEGGGNVTVNQSFNFAANGDESVKRIIAEAAPGIAKMTEAQIVNSRQRGGQMRRVFS